MASIVSQSTQSAQPPHRRGPSAGKIVSNILQYALLIVLAILFLIPFYLIIRNGLATDEEITALHWTFFPSALHFENIQELFDDLSVPFAQGLFNSAVIAVLSTVGQLFFCCLAGYGLARIPYRWSNIVFYAIIVTLMIPSTVTFVPTYVLISYLGWVSTLQGIIVPFLFSGFTTFLFRQFFLSFPHELEEAGRVDGLGQWGVFWRIVIPNSYSIIASLGVIALYPKLELFPVASGDWTRPIRLYCAGGPLELLNAQVLNLHELFIGSAIAILPLVIVFFILQRYIAEGFKQTGLKDSR